MTEIVKLDGLLPRELRVKSSRILLESLEVQADIGFHEFEVGKPQRLLVTVEIWLDDLTAPAADDPAEAWDYDLLRSEILRLASARRYNLQETLIHAIYERLAAMRGVKALRVKSAKPDIYPDAKAVGVDSILCRTRAAGGCRGVTIAEQNSLRRHFASIKEARVPLMLC